MDNHTEQRDQRRNYTIRQTAEILCLSEKTITRKIASAAIKAVKVSERRWVIPGAEIDRILSGAAA